MTEKREPLFERTGPLLAIFLLAGLAVFTAAFLTVHKRASQELLANPGSQRSNLVISYWLNEGYFHYYGLMMWPPMSKVNVYRSSTGGYMVSAFLLEKLYIAFFGHYSWRLIAIHNELVALLLSSLLGLLAFRVSRRIGLDSRLAFAAGLSVVIV